MEKQPRLKPREVVNPRLMSDLARRTSELYPRVFSREPSARFVPEPRPLNADQQRLLGQLGIDDLHHMGD